MLESPQTIQATDCCWLCARTGGKTLLLKEPHVHALTWRNQGGFELETPTLLVGSLIAKRGSADFQGRTVLKIPAGL